MTLSDTELIKKAKTGDHLSFQQLVNRYDRSVLSIALRYVNDADDAKDIYQEVFIRVYKGLKNFEFKSEFSTWLFRITTNVCLTYKMKLNKHQHISISEEYDDENSNQQIEDERNVTPEEYAANNEISANIYAALEKLSPRQKMIFLLKHYEGYKIREIAKIMELNEGTIKKYLFEAVHKLKFELKEIYG
jgi:RNA polymerase sigma-70 factor, ECF subfamily